MTDDTAEEDVSFYVLRIGERATRDIEEAVVRFADLESDQIAYEWQRGLFELFRTLKENPRRFPQARERRAFSADVRQALYRRTNHSVAYRLLYRVEDMTDDGPRVLLLHVRHSAAKDVTRKEARVIEAQSDITDRN